MAQSNKSYSKYSFFELFKHGLNHHQNWSESWRKAKPKKSYDAVIIGGGGHGLATAYYLASKHKITNIALLEKGWIGGGNTGRNTTIIRSNYLWDESSLLYEHALQLWEGLTDELNFNLMFSQRGVFNLGHSLQDMRDIERRVNANNLNGIDAYILNAKEVKELIKPINISKNVRYPILGSSYQPRAGVARHDALVWGFARACNRMGVDIIENCEVKGFEIENNQIQAIDTTRGLIKTTKVGSVVAGHSSVIASMLELRLPVTSHPLQAFVSEPIKPILNTVVMSNAVHGYVSQSNKGDLVIGAGIDVYSGYSQRGNSRVIEHCVAAILELFPCFSRVRMNRQWGGIVDTTPDACPIISPTKVKGFFINCGWGTGGFKSIPGSGDVFAHLLATNSHHRLSKPFDINRFTTGALVDEHGAAGVAH